ncbi:MAG: hypothetical protein OHK0053_38490 [Microscillaceae bacterium]
MNRRKFLKNFASLAGLGWAACQPSAPSAFPFPVYNSKEHRVGHLLRQGSTWPRLAAKKTDFLIIGGGLAGLTAAYSLKNEDFILCELGQDFGGTASAQFHGTISLCQGAHYDLSYPDYFGEEVLGLLRGLNIIHKKGAIWQFKDTQYLIQAEQEEQCLANAQYREGVLPDTKASRDFFAHTDAYVGQLCLPSRLTPAALLPLSRQSFATYLAQNHLAAPSEIRRGIDYQMRDDYGAPAAQVSALAGLYYYASRAWENEEYQIFSPPEGNYYFSKRFLSHLPPAALHSAHLVYQIAPRKKGFTVLALDISQQACLEIETQAIVYAAPKYTLPYVFPADAPLFKTVEYAPWAVVNLIFPNNALSATAFWQNETLHRTPSAYLGFVDSASQHQSPQKRVLTAYFNFAPRQRPQLLEWAENPQMLVKEALREIAHYFDVSSSELIRQTKAAFVKIMGHAMPIAAPGYLCQDQNPARSHPRLVYAGVDNGRLPLLLEALDSGLEAVKQLRSTGLG